MHEAKSIGQSSVCNVSEATLIVAKLNKQLFVSSELRVQLLSLRAKSESTSWRAGTAPGV